MGPRGLAELLDVLDGAKEVGALQEDRGGLVVDGLGEGARVGQAAIHADLVDLGAVALRVGGEGLAAVRVHGPGDDEAAALGRRHRQIAGGRDRGRALIEPGAGERERRQL